MGYEIWEIRSPSMVQQYGGIIAIPVLYTYWYRHIESEVLKAFKTIPSPASLLIQEYLLISVTSSKDKVRILTSVNI